MQNTWLDNLKTPKLQYRGIPFWSWNDSITPAEARRQVRDMAAAGFGGFFIHARAGLKTPYMGEDWMDCVEACIEESRLVGIKTWLYDENGYPSGFAGGNVPGRGLSFQQKHLHFERLAVKDCIGLDFVLGHYAPHGEGMRVDPKKMAPDDPVLRVSFSVNPYYSDLLNPEAAAAFLEESYEPYNKRFGRFFGKEIAGIFTDEPQLGRTGMPWSHVLPACFKQRYGYDLLDRLPALAMKTEDCATVRHDFWECVTALFTNSYIATLRSWCEDHHCLLTGHALLEEDIRRQILGSGSAMAMYRHMHIPGVDWLGRNTGNPFLLRQVASAAAQTGNPLVLSEMFAAAGWNTTPKDLKHLAEWQYACGINLLCAHLYAYSISGSRKKDHPPVIAFQANWWEAIRPLNDHLSRLGQLLSEGDRMADLLVIHPLRGGWSTLDASCSEQETNPAIQALEDACIELENTLTHAWIDHDLGDEGMLEEMGSVVSEWLQVGARRYRVVLIPDTPVLEEATIRLLHRFAQNGGVIWRMGEMPDFARLPVDADAKRIRTQLAASCVQLKPTGDLPTLAQAFGLAQFRAEGVDGAASTAVIARHVRYGDGHVLFLVNMDDRNRFCGRIYRADPRETIHTGNFSAQRIDLLSLSTTPIPDTGEGIPITLEPAESLLLYLQETDPDKRQTTESRMAMPLQEEPVQMDPAWQLENVCENLLLLDTCQYAPEEGDWSEPVPVCEVQKRLLAGGHTVPVKLRFSVLSELDAAGTKGCSLIVEHPETMTVRVNGQQLQQREAVYWKEPLFGLFPLDGRLRPGKNIIELHTTFMHSPALRNQLERAKVFEAEMNMLTCLTELENLFISGPFRVGHRGKATPHGSGCLLLEGPFVLQPPAQTIEADPTTEGFPFFTGKLTVYRTIKLPDPLPDGAYIARWHPACAWSEIVVNQTIVKRSLWAPHEVDITPFLHGGSNRVALTLASTDRNVFGPHHHPAGELRNTGPAHFTDKDGWAQTYSVMPFGPGTLDIVRVTGTPTNRQAEGCEDGHHQKRRDMEAF